MVLNRLINGILKISFYTILLLVFSCEEEGWPTDCNECSFDEPTQATLIAKLGQNYSDGGLVTVRLYEGDIEDNILVISLDTYEDTYVVDVSLNKKYTLTASYHYNGSVYTAVDSATPMVKLDKTSCDEPCYYIYDTNLNLRLNRH